MNAPRAGLAVVCALAALANAAPTGLQVTARARSERPGELVVLTIDGAGRGGGVRVRAFGRDVPAYAVSDGEWRALVGIDLDVKPGTYPVSVQAGSPEQHVVHDLVVAPRAFRTRRLTVDEAFVTPPASEQERIAREAALLERVWTSPPRAPLWTGAFVRPVPQPANSAFGTRSIFNGKPRNAHGGADFLSPAGTPVHAPNAGRVAVARNLYFSGNTVVLEHGAGLFSMLAQLSAIEVAEGDTVVAGQVVGLVGATGRVTGPHLHWAVRAGGGRIDPLSLLAMLGSS
jgi:murein DD-endopeptidase MepM/ murein hydrolase activator NlpD